MADQIPGLITPGNLDLTNRPRVPNAAAGGTSSVFSMTVGMQDENGNEVTYLIPRVTEDGRILEPDAAIENFRRTKQHMGVFSNEPDATAFSKKHSDTVGREGTLLDAINKSLERQP